jgi:hypothetical protein
VAVQYGRIGRLTPHDGGFLVRGAVAKVDDVAVSGQIYGQDDAGNILFFTIYAAPGTVSHRQSCHLDTPYYISFVFSRGRLNDSTAYV